MTTKHVSWALAVSAILGAGSVVHAGIFSSVPWTSLPPANYVATLGNPPTTATIDVVLTAPAGTYTIGGTVTGDPILLILQQISNTTDQPWTGYQFQITPTDGSSITYGSIVVDTTDGLNFLIPPYPNLATFLPHAVADQNTDTVAYSGGSMAPGADASIWIYMNVVPSSDNYFHYSLVYGPVPEPASLGLLAVGALALLAKRRRAA